MFEHKELRIRYDKPTSVRRMCRLERVEAGVYIGILRSEGLHDLYCSNNIVKITK
jgi:hypothetical protein